MQEKTIKRAVLLAAVLLMLATCSAALVYTQGWMRCPGGMVYFEAGPVSFGTHDIDRLWSREPGSALLGAFCMDIYEYPNKKGVEPRNYVNWYEAHELCAAEGKRLCTENEWDRACGGPEGRDYCYGNEHEAGRCNWGDGGQGGALPRRPSGFFPECVSPEGVYDLNGNLSEWTSTPYDQPPYRRQYILRGGTSWWSDAYGQDCTSRHTHFPEDNTRVDDGLRCCRDPRY